MRLPILVLWSFGHLFILGCKEHLLNTYYLSGILVGTGEMEIIIKVPSLKEPIKSNLLVCCCNKAAYRWFCSTVLCNNPHLLSHYGSAGQLELGRCRLGGSLSGCDSAMLGSRLWVGFRSSPCIFVLRPRWKGQQIPWGMLFSWQATERQHPNYTTQAHLI